MEKAYLHIRSLIIRSGLTFLCFFILACHNETKASQIVSLRKEQRASFETIEDAEVFLNQYLEDTNTFEREFRNLLNNSPNGNIEKAQGINNNLVEILVSVKYQLETSKALILYYGNKPIDCIGNLIDMQASCSIGNGCNESFRTIEVFGDIELNNETLELLNVEILVYGVVRFNGEILNINDVNNGVYENIKLRCSNSKITLI